MLRVSFQVGTRIWPHSLVVTTLDCPLIGLGGLEDDGAPKKPGEIRFLRMRAKS